MREDLDIDLWQAWGATWPIPTYRRSVRTFWYQNGVVVLGSSWESLAKTARLLVPLRGDARNSVFLFPSLPWNAFIRGPGMLPLVAAARALHLLKLGPAHPEVQRELALHALQRLL